MGTLVLELIRKFEGCKLDAYLDSVGIPTLGYGHTQGVVMGDRITQADADRLLEHDVGLAEQGVLDCLMLSPALNQNEWAALTSFVFNLGVASLRTSTLLRLLNSGAPRAAVAEEFLKWDHAGGKVLPGLLRRRQAEADLFLSPVDTGGTSILSSEDSL